MNGELLLGPASPLWSPAAFAGLLAVALALMWLAFSPVRSARPDDERLEGYLRREIHLDDADLHEPVMRRVIIPVFRTLLRSLGGLTPTRNLQATQHMLLQAGNPGKLTALDFLGLRLVVMAVISGLCFLLMIQEQPLIIAVRNTGIAGVLGYFLPNFWLRSKVDQRRRAITRALPDALDMLTIGVEAGLAFESALLRVSEKWRNPLTEEFRRAVGEMRVGASREASLERLAERCDVPELNTFVAILVQSSQLGVSISQVLHNQAAEMRLKRRQRAEELARQASIKIMFPLAFFIFPALFVVILGPAVPQIIGTFGGMGGK